MALRDVLIKLRLDTSQFKTAIAAASANTKAFAAQTSTEAGKAGKSLGLLPGSYATIGLAAGAAGVASLRAAADFEQGMANVRATGAASASQMHDLRDAALEMGQTTVYSSTEAAGGMEALLKAGLSAKDVIGGGLTGSFDLAAAGGLEVAEAAETAAAAMAQFSLSGEDVPHIADLLAAGAGKASGDVRDLGQALNQAGLVAAGAGATIEETTGTLSAFANAGLLGSDAGTSFKTMLQRLQNPAAEAAGLMDKLNISAYDANGNFVGLAKIAGQLQKAFKDSSAETRNQALATIFGADAVRAANVLYKEGADGITEWTQKVNDAGYAADVAAQKTDTLKGDLDKMRNSWRALAEGAGGDGKGFIRPFVQGLDEIADALNKAGDEMGDFGIRFGALRDFLDARELGIDTDVYIRFKTEGSANAIAEAAKVATAQGMSDRTVTAILEKRGWSTEGIDLVLERMRQVDEKKATALVDLIGDTETLADLGVVDTALDKTDAKNPKVPITLEGVPKSLREILSVQTGLNKLDKTDATPTVSLDTSEAMGKITRLQRLLDNFVNDSKQVGEGTVLARASGGAVYGPGTTTSDSIPARLSDGEHVLTASDVNKLGGQSAVYQLRRAIQSGAFAFAGGGAAYAQPTRAYASGGAVSSGSSTVRSEIAISIRDFSFDAQRMTASMHVLALNAADHVIAEREFEASL